MSKTSFKIKSDQQLPRFSTSDKNSTSLCYRLFINHCCMCWFLLPENTLLAIVDLMDVKRLGKNYYFRLITQLPKQRNKKLKSEELQSRLILVATWRMVARRTWSLQIRILADFLSKKLLLPNQVIKQVNAFAIFFYWKQS